MSWESIKTWAGNAASSFSQKSGLSGFLMDPVGSVTDYLTDQAVSYAKQKLLPGGSQTPISDSIPMPSAGYVSASKAQSGVAGSFSAGKVGVPGMNVDRVRSAYDNLYSNTGSLRVPNVRLTVEYTTPNIRGSSGTIPLGTSDVGRQKIKTTTKSALTRIG